VKTRQVFCCSKKGTYDEDSLAFDVVVSEQSEVVPHSSREREIICLGPRVDRKQGYTKRPGDTANIQYQTWCIGNKFWEHVLRDKCREDIVSMNECVNVLVGNTVDRKVGPRVANVVDQNGYMELLEGREEGTPIFDTLAGIRTDSDDVHSSVCSLELGLNLGEFLSVTAMYY